MQSAAKERGINIWRTDDDHVSIACDEATTAAHVAQVLDVFSASPGVYARPEIATGQANS